MMIMCILILRGLLRGDKADMENIEFLEKANKS